MPAAFAVAPDDQLFLDALCEGIRRLAAGLTGEVADLGQGLGLGQRAATSIWMRFASFGGMLPGPSNANQAGRSTPCTRASATVGTSGSTSRRFSLVTASMRKVPLR